MLKGSNFVLIGVVLHVQVYIMIDRMQALFPHIDRWEFIVYKDALKHFEVADKPKNHGQPIKLLTEKYFSAAHMLKLSCRGALHISWL